MELIDITNDVRGTDALVETRNTDGGKMDINSPGEGYLCLVTAVDIVVAAVVIVEGVVCREQT